MTDFLGTRVRAQKVLTLLAVLQERQFQLDAEQAHSGKLDGDLCSTRDGHTFGLERERLAAEIARLVESNEALMPTIEAIVEEQNRDAEDEAHRRNVMTREQRIAERHGQQKPHPASRPSRRKRAKR